MVGGNKILHDKRKIQIQW